MNFYCQGCDNWNEGQGVDKCLSCQINLKANKTWDTIRPDSYDPQVLESFAPTTIVLDRFGCLTFKEMTYICQNTICGMSQQQIAEYHKSTRGAVRKVISRAKKRIREQM